MTQQEFESKMHRARTMRDLGERPGYYTGYLRGLRRLFHGEKFGTGAEHQKWLRLLDDPDEARHERGRGYLDGFTGKDPMQPSREA